LTDQAGGERDSFFPRQILVEIRKGQKMFGRKVNPVRRRNSILILAGLFLVMAVIDKPSLLLFFTSSKQFISIVLIVAAAFVATLGIYRFVEPIFGRGNSPWYARPGAVIFLAVALMGINAMFMILDNLFANILGTGPFLVHKAYIYLFMAFELVWILLLE